MTTTTHTGIQGSRFSEPMAIVADVRASVSPPLARCRAACYTLARRRLGARCPPTHVTSSVT
ncbi:ORFL317W [Human betaherpesvirus 5]|nr:ORFL317W [Human betaherpesvirus 5]